MTESQRLRFRAEEVRVYAEKMREASARWVMEQCAQDLDLSAERAERAERKEWRKPTKSARERALAA